MRFKLAVVALLLGGSFFGFWNGFDSVRISQYSSELATFTMDEVERNGIGDKRYIKITDAFWDGSYVYQVNLKKRETNARPDSAIKYIEYPLLSANDVAAIQAGELVTAKVIVLRNTNDLQYKDMDAWVEQNIEIGRTSSVEGVTRVGLDSIDGESKRVLKSLDMNVSDDVIFIEAGRKPNSTVYGLGILLASALAALTGIGLSVYWLLSWTKR